MTEQKQDDNRQLYKDFQEWWKDIIIKIKSNNFRGFTTMVKSGKMYIRLPDEYVPPYTRLYRLYGAAGALKLYELESTNFTEIKGHPLQMINRGTGKKRRRG